MINTNPIVRIRRSAVPGKRPTVGQLLLGELGLNTYDANLYTLRNRPGIGTDVVNLGAGATVTNILYVTQDGNDTNTGKKLGDAKRTIRAALAEATTGTVIKVSAGSYVENNPLVIPKQVSVVGDSLREVSVIPQNSDQDLFHVSNGNYIAEMAYTGSLNPGKAIFAFNPNQIDYFDQSPYVQNCTNFIPNSIGMKIDGNHAIGPTKSMVVDSYTQYNQGGIGVSITNEGYAQLVSLFTICDDVAVFCGSGAACDLTNSNSSFGNFGLIADGVGPLKYTGIVTQTSNPNSDVFVINLNTPTLSISTAIYDNKTGILTAYTTEPHKFSVGMGITLSNLQFTCTGIGGTAFYPDGAKGYVFEAKTVAPGRYVDASNSIRANAQEIKDKSLASIALNHPDFVFPGDPAASSRYRYFDSYRLIQKNKQEIIDKSLASIAVGFPSAFKFPDDPSPYQRNRYYDASGLIQRNKQEIVDKSLASIAVGFPSGFYFPDEAQTNSRSRFYDASRLIIVNRQEIIDKSLGAVAIAHSDFYFPGDAQTNSRSRYFDAYRLIQNNKNVIVSVAWTNTQVVYTGISTTEEKCKRDLGFFIDAISTDVLTGGNNYAREFTLQYFNNGVPISNGLLGEEQQSIYAFHQARTLMKNAITNTLVGAAYSDLTITADPLTGFNTSPSSCANVQSNIDNLVGIVTVSVGAGNTSSLPTPNYGYFNQTVGIGTTSSPGGFKCARDINFLIEAISTDVFTGGNKYSRDFTLQYFNNSGSPISNGLVGEVVESITAFNAVRDFSKKAITNQLNVKNLGISSGPSNYGGPGVAHTVYQSGNPNACADVQTNIDNLVGIVTTVIGSGTTTFLSTFNENLGISTTNKCARDLGFLVEAISTDVFTGGNKYSRDFTLQYFDNSGNPIGAGLTGEEIQSIYAFNTVRDYAKKAITNQLNVKNLGISSGPSNYGGPGVAHTVFPSGNPNACADVQSNINNLVGIVTTVIGAGTTAYLSTFSENLGISTTNKCARDLGYLVDAVSTDVFTGGNKYSRDFTNFYFTGTTPVGIGTSEKLQSVYAFNTLREYSKKAITNQLNYKEVGISSGPANYGGPGNSIPVLPSGSPTACADVQSNIDNLVGIVTTVIGNGNQNFLTTFSENIGSFPSGTNKCYRDIGYLLDSLILDVRDFTNTNIRKFIKGYFDGNGNPIINGIVGEVAESITAFNSIRDYSKKAITNQLNVRDLSLVADPLTGFNTSPNSCANVQTFIDNLVATVNSNSVGIASTKLNLPSVSLASTVFTCNVGVSTTPNQVYVGGGNAAINVSRPFDGQVVYLGDLFYTVERVIVGTAGTGYNFNPSVTIESPEVSWGIGAQAAAIVNNGSVTEYEIISNGRGYTYPPKVTVSSPEVGINTATAIAVLVPTYYSIVSSTPISSGICTITLNDNVPYSIGVGTEVAFYKQSRVLASGHSLEYIGSGTDISKCLPSQGGVAIQDNETTARNGGLVVFTSTDQSGNFRIGDGVVINQQTGTISGTFYSKSLFSTLTPFILALGGD